jgi:phage baseplate assembly protein gpV/phage protein D
MKSLLAVTRVQVVADGKALASELCQALSTVRVEHGLSEPAQCELTFVDCDGPLAIGMSLEVTIRDQTDALFVGEVTGIQHTYEPMRGRIVRVRAYDKLHRLRKRGRIRSHVRANVADVARELTADLGISVEGECGPLWTHLVQHRQSDLDFLGELSERCGLHFILRGGTLSLLTLAGAGDPIALSLGDNLLEAAIDCSSDGASRSIETIGWNPRRAELHQGSAVQARSGRSVDAAAEPSAFGLDGEQTMTDAVVEDDAQAEALAQSLLDRRTAAEVVLNGVCEGDARLAPGCLVEIDGTAIAHCGRYVVTSVVHTISAQRGFLSEIYSGPPAVRARPALPIAALGTVTRIDDPENLGRVRVALPGYAGLETDWIGVLSAGAGAGKGLVALPDHDDQVLVLFPNGDPAHGIAIGGLYGVTAPPDIGIDDGKVRRFSLQTPGGQRLRLDDGNHKIRIENDRGSFVELTPDRLTVHAENADLRLEAPGHTVSIRGAAVDFSKA